MPSIYVKKEHYDQIIKLGYDITKFVNQAVVDKLETEKKEKWGQDNNKHAGE